MNIDLEKILIAWKEGYDGKIPGGKDERVVAFIQLFKDIEANLAKEDPLLSQEVLIEEVESLVKRHKDAICSMCVNENHRDRKKLAIWKDMVKTNFIQAIARYSPPVRGVVTAQDLTVKRVEQLDLPPELPPELQEAEQVSINVPMLDLSKIKGIVKPTVVYDEEFSKLLGLDNE